MVCGINFHKIFLEKKLFKFRHKIFMKCFRPLTTVP